MNFETSEFYETLERQLGCDFSDFYIFSNSQESHIHDQRYRIAEFYLPETKPSEERFPQRYGTAKGTVSDYICGYEKVDNADSELRSGLW